VVNELTLSSGEAAAVDQASVATVAGKRKPAAGNNAPGTTCQTRNDDNCDKYDISTCSAYTNALISARENVCNNSKNEKSHFWDFEKNVKNVRTVSKAT